MMILTDAEKKFIKEKLRTKIERTKIKIDRMIEMTEPIGPENAIGRVSRMDAINNKGVMEAALRSSQEELDAMHSALRRMESGDDSFGLCERCGQAIPFQRIALMPGSTRCVRCA